MTSESDLRIVLLGKTGSGKSASGNTILGKKVFGVVDFLKSANKLCEKQKGVVEGKTVSIIDTPGLFNTAVNERQLMDELQKCVLLSAPGPHVFLLVIKLGARFTKEERDAVRCFQELFGDEVLCRTIVVFTHADQLKGKPVDEYLSKSQYLQETVHNCGGRYHPLNNQDTSRGQVEELLKKIYAVVKENGMRHYTIEMFRATQTKKRRNMVKATCAVTVAVVGIVGIVKTALVVAAAMADRTATAAPEYAVLITGEAAVERAAETAVTSAVEKSVESVGAAVEKAIVEPALEKAAEGVVTSAVEKTVEGVGAIVEKAIVDPGEVALEKAAEGVVSSAVEKTVEGVGAAVEKAIVEPGEAAVEKATEAVGGAAGAEMGMQAAVTGVEAAVAAAGARAAAAAGKLSRSGAVAAAVAAAVTLGGATVIFITALKQWLKNSS